ncbi:hypothetical protein GCM10028821_46310 [Hymenobacter jeollabukensis]
MTMNAKALALKGLVGGLIVALMLAPPPTAQAQFLTTDVPHIAVQVGEFAKKAADWVKTLQNYQVVRDAYTVATTAKDISSRIRDISSEVKNLTSDALDLQNTIQNDLKKVASIRDLKLANVPQLLNTALDLTATKGGLTTLFPSVSRAARLQTALATRGTSDIQTVAGIFNQFQAGTSSRKTFQQVQTAGQETALAGLALENMQQKAQIQQAFDYQRIADEMTAQAAETQATLKNEGRYKMTEAERLNSLNNAQNSLMEANRLRGQANDLLAQASSKGPATQAAEAVYRDKMLSASMNALSNSFQ